MSLLRKSVACLVAGGFVLGLVFMELSRRQQPGCDIKGNISYLTGEHIYHVPGQKYYSLTTINRWRGERWFCSEGAAVAAGWRKSKI
jgi:hypothetical protein